MMWMGHGDRPKKARQAQVRVVTPSFLLVLLLAAFHGMPAHGAHYTNRTFHADIRPIVARYCFDCHNSDKHKGDVVLDKSKSDADLQRDRHTWEKVLENVRSRAMPPEMKPQPAEEERALLADWLEAKLFAVDCTKPDPGRVTIRRLNRTEYNNTIRDLVGVDFQPADDFPADDVGYGFDNIGDVLSMPPVLLEKYLAAAEKILESAIVIPGSGPKRQRFSGAALKGTRVPDYTSSVRTIMESGELYADYNSPAEGEYTINVRAFQIDGNGGMARMSVKVGGKAVKDFDVRAQEQKPGTYEATAVLRPGTNRISVSFLAAVATNAADGKPRKAATKIPRLLVQHVEVAATATPAFHPETHQRIFACGHTNAVAHSTSCARNAVGRFAERAFRRPVTTNETDRLLRIYEDVKAGGEPFERAVQLSLQAVLVSPHFLFRGEIVPHPNDPKSAHPVNEFALASRLSYFLWSSMPDDELFQLARRAELRKRGVLEAQVKRMLADAKSQAFVENFTGQWLQTRNLWRVTPDTNVFASFNDLLRADMERETQHFFASVMREDASILDFIDGRHTFVNERLAQHYGISGIKGDHFRKVTFKDKRRAGVLTHASVLTITSNPNRTSPVKRGKWVLDNLLGTPPPPPPPGVPELKEGKELSGTLRQRLEQHRADPACASCHDRMDPIGFGMENFDAVGVWRDADGGVPIDTTGTWPGGKTFKGAADLRQILRGQKELFTRCLTEKMLTYALGRGLEYYDRCAVEKITAAVAKKDYRFNVLVTEIVKSVPFQMKRGDDGR